LNASSTFWNDCCSLPPQREVTVIEPPVTAEPPGASLPPVLAAGADPPALGAGVALEPQALRINIAAMGNVIRRGNLAIGLLLC
jgi:hypothetical protein